MSGVKQRYTRVPTEEEESKRAAAKKRRSDAAEMISTKIQALAWVATGIFVAYQTDLPAVILSDPDVNRFWFNIAATCFTMNTVLCAYLTIWLPYIQRVTTEWSVYCPRVIPTMTGIGVLCGISRAPPRPDARPARPTTARPSQAHPGALARLGAPHALHPRHHLHGSPHVAALHPMAVLTSTSVRPPTASS